MEIVSFSTFACTLYNQSVDVTSKPLTQQLTEVVAVCNEQNPFIFNSVPLRFPP